MAKLQSRSATTRTRLCVAFRQSLLDRGLEATTTDAVLRSAGISKGAMYHQFKSKGDIIEAIYREESHGAIMRAVAAAGSAKTPIERLKVSCQAWLDELGNSDVAKLLLEIGPASLGLQRVAEIENELSLRLIEGLLKEAVETGELRMCRTALAARLINALMGEIAIQKPDDRQAAAIALGPMIDAMLESLRV